jgi:hypothetical protein
MKRPQFGVACVAAALVLAGVPASALAAPASSSEKAPQLGPVAIDAPIVTAHSGVFGGKTVDYDAIVEPFDTLGLDGKPAAKLVATSYVARSSDPRRPVVFVFNGGPIAATTPLHLGLFGPKRIAAPDDIRADPATFKLVDNIYSPLDATDIVIFDPASTGYSRTLPGVPVDSQFSTKADARQLAQLVNLWIKRQGAYRNPVGAGLKLIDHLTHNVYGGRMAHWASFYERIFNFREIRYFDIKGEYTGLTSKALTAPDGKIRIPLNEEGKAGGGQIEEYLRAFNGEGIQHIAFICDDLLDTWDRLKSLGIPFMTAPPATYYEMLDERLPGHGEPVEELQKRGILLDGSTEKGDPRLLLQIFSETVIGPVFFEFIQRKRDEGFGEGNFTALFKSIERDQLRRGVLETAEARA